MPSLNLSVGSGADDTRWDGGDFSNSEAYVNCPGIASWGSEKHLSFRFTGVSGLSGANISSATLEVYVYGLQGTGCQLRVYADDSAAPTAPTTAGEFTGKTLTTAYVDWDGDPVTGDFNQSPNIASIIQELVDSYDPSAIQLFLKNDHANDAANHFWQTLSYDYGVSAAASLYITYTAGGSPVTITLSAASITASPQTTPAYNFQMLRPNADSSLGGWTDQASGTTNIYQSIDDVTPSDSDYVQSASLPTSSVARFKLSNGDDPGSDNNHFVVYRYRKPENAGTVNLTVRLMEGTTTRATWTHNGIGTEWTTVNQLLSGAEAASITDYTNLYIELEATGTT